MVHFNTIIGTILSPLTKPALPIPASSTLSLTIKKYKLQFFNGTSMNQKWRGLNVSEIKMSNTILNN